MSVVLSIEEIGPCRKKLRIEIPAPAVEAESQRVLGEYARKAKVAGFRKGKVPAAIVRRQFGDDIRHDVVERLLPRYWRQAAAEKSIDPLGQPTVDEVEQKEGEPLVFTASVDVRPEVELRNYKDFALPEIAAEAGADEIEKAIEDLRRSRADWLPAERAAAVGDRVRLEVKELGEEGAEAHTTEVEVGSPRVWEELSLAVTGLAAGQTGRFQRASDAADGEPSVVRSFELRLLEVLEARLPAVDDEFVRHFGEFAAVADFEADVARRLSQAKADEAHQERERAMLDQLTERHPLPLPEGVVHTEIETILREYAERLARQGVDIEKAEIDWQKVGEDARPHAERRVRARLILDAIAEQESIEVGEQEFEQTLGLLARVQGIASGALRQRMDEAGELAGLRSRMRREKVVRHLLGEEAGPGGAAAGSATDKGAADEGAGVTAAEAGGTAGESEATAKAGDD